MTRLLTSGWETGDINEVPTGSGDNGFGSSISVVSSSPTARSGTYSLRNQTKCGAWRTFTLSAARSELWLRCGFYASTISSQFTILMYADNAGTAQCSVSFNGSDNLFRLHIGNGGTQLGSAASAAAPQSAWHLLEWRTQILTATTGVSELWLDGARVINFSGDNSATSQLDMRYLYVGIMNLVGGCTGLATPTLAFDDLAVNDTSGTLNNGQIGDGRVVLLKPTGAGSNTNQTRGGTDSGANWSQVDELPPSMTDYVYSATAGVRDTYALEDVPAGTWSVNCVESIAYALNSDAGAGSLGLTLKSGATTNEATAAALSTTATYYRQLYETDPNTGSAWTVAAVNALEAGTTVR